MPAPRSIMKQRASSGKKKRVRLNLTPNEKTISPTNHRMKADLFCKLPRLKAYRRSPTGL